MIESLEKPYWQPKHETLYLVRSDILTLLERKEKGILRHYLSNLIQMKKHSYFENTLETPVKTASKDTLTKCFKAYKETGVFEVTRSGKGLGLCLPEYYPKKMEEWPVIHGGYLKIRTGELKKALTSLKDSSFRAYLLMKYLGLSLRELTIRVLEKAFSLSLKTIKKVIDSLRSFFNPKKEEPQEQEEKKPAISVMDLFNEKIKELSLSKSFKNKPHKRFDVHGLEGLNQKTLSNLVKDGGISEKEMKISLRRFSEWYFSTLKTNKIEDPKAYFVSVIRTNGRFVPPESWLINQYKSENVSVKVQFDPCFDEENSFIENKQREKKRYFEFLSSLKGA